MTKTPDSQWRHRSYGWYSDSYMGPFFERHRAYREVGRAAGVELDVLNWREPGSGVNGLVYCMADGVLSVTGDQGGAVYQFKSQRDLVELGQHSSLSHFLDKLVAGSSDQGPPGCRWDPEIAFFRCVEMLSQYRESQPYAKLPDIDFAENWLTDPETVATLGFDIELEEVEMACASFLEFYEFRQEYEKLFPDGDHVDGFIPSMQVQLHHYGLRLAAAQLSAG